MKKLVICAGGFHPFHAGHKALYDQAVAAFPSADVFVAATADTSTRPFPFKIKQKLAKLAGIPPHRFIQVTSPFRAQEITQMYDPNTTQLIFVRSEKDRDQQPQPGGVKKDGTPGYLQPYKRNGLQPMNKHGYMAYLPTVQFGPGMTSATEIRAKWPTLTPKQKAKLVNSLYPATDNNDQLTSVTVRTLDAVLGESVDEGIKGAIIGGLAGSELGPTGMEVGAKIGSALQDKFEPLLTKSTVDEGIAIPGNEHWINSVNKAKASGEKSPFMLYNMHQNVPKRHFHQFATDVGADFSGSEAFERELLKAKLAGKAKNLRQDRNIKVAAKIGVDEGKAKPPKEFDPIKSAEHDAALRLALINAKRHYNKFADEPIMAFLKWVQRSLLHSEKEDKVQDAKLMDLTAMVKELGRRIQAQEKKKAVAEAALVNDPKQGHLIRPDGGLGTWDEKSLSSNLTAKFRDIVDFLKAKNYSGIEHVLYKAGAMESMVRALAQYERFLKKQGQRPLAKGRVVDMNQIGEDYVEECPADNTPGSGALAPAPVQPANLPPQ